MKFDYLDERDSRKIINNMFILSFDKSDLPFNTIIVPTGFPSMAYVFGKKQTVTHNKKVTEFNGLIITGQFDSTYNFSVNSIGKNLGINLHPTALYKFLKKDISKLTNKHIPLEEINAELFNMISPLFIRNEKSISNFTKKIIDLIEGFNIEIDQETKHIDGAINYIFEKEGMIQVNDLLNVVPFSQKSLEVKFKKIVGLTPGKYIRLIRFTKLMRKYESNEIELKDLIYMYNYYDHSHFIKDFKHFMSESPKLYFKKDYPLIKAYSKDL